MALLARRSSVRAAEGASPRRSRQLAWTLLGLIVVVMAASLVIGFTGGETWSAKPAVIPVELALAVVGALVAGRTGNRLGWLFLASGTAGAVAALAGAYAARVPAAPSAADASGGDGRGGRRAGSFWVS